MGHPVVRSLFNAVELRPKDLLDVTVSPRYQGMQTQIEHLVMDSVREQLNRRQGTDNITRSFLKFLGRHSVLS